MNNNLFNFRKIANLMAANTNLIMIKPLLILSLLLAICNFAQAQNFPFGQYNEKEMNMTKYDKDTSAHAVVLREFGDSRIAETTDDKLKVIHIFHSRVKILDEKALDEGNIEVLFYYDDNDSFEEVDEIKAITYYKDDNGLVQKAELDRSQIFTVNENERWKKVKFALPHVQKGCIVEYQFEVKSPYISTFRSWIFQSDIPKIYSDYEVHIPATFTYNVVLRGGLKLSKNTAEIEQNAFLPMVQKAIVH